MTDSEELKQETDKGETETETETEKGYELLGEDITNYDLSFKVIVIGNSGKKYI